MQRPPLLETDGFCFRKTRFETYVRSKDLDLLEIIQNGNFEFMVKDLETKLLLKKPHLDLNDDERRKLGKNDEAKMLIYNALPRREFKRVHVCKTAKDIWHSLIITHQGNSQVKHCKIDLLIQHIRSLRSRMRKPLIMVIQGSMLLSLASRLWTLASITRTM